MQREVLSTRQSRDRRDGGIEQQAVGHSDDDNGVVRESLRRRDLDRAGVDVGVAGVGACGDVVQRQRARADLGQDVGRRGAVEEDAAEGAAGVVVADCQRLVRVDPACDSPVARQTVDLLVEAIQVQSRASTEDDVAFARTIRDVDIVCTAKPQGAGSDDGVAVVGVGDVAQNKGSAAGLDESSSSIRRNHRGNRCGVRAKVVDDQIGIGPSGQCATGENRGRYSRRRRNQDAARGDGIGAGDRHRDWRGGVEPNAIRRQACDRARSGHIRVVARCPCIDRVGTEGGDVARYCAVACAHGPVIPVTKSRPAAEDRRAGVRRDGVDLAVAREVRSAACGAGDCTQRDDHGAAGTDG